MNKKLLPFFTEWYTPTNALHWLVFIIQWIEKMHGETLKFVNSQQAKPYNIYKNTSGDW